MAQPLVRKLAREALVEAFCVLRAQRNRVRDWLGAAWSELPPVVQWRETAGALRAVAERFDQVADEVERFLEAKRKEAGGGK